MTYMAIFRMGAVALPMSSLFGPDALAFRLTPRRRQGRRQLGRERPQGARGPRRRRRGRHRGRRRRPGRRARLRRRPGRRQRRLRARLHPPRRPGLPHLHLGHDGRPEGRAPRPPHRLRPDPRVPGGVRVLSAAGRRVLVAGRLGVDRRAHGHPDPGVVLRPADRGRPRRRLQRRAGRLADAGVRRDPHAAAADGPAGHPRRRPAGRRLRPARRAVGRRGPGRRPPRLGPGVLRLHRQRGLRPDRVQRPHRQLRQRLPGEAGFARAGPARARSWPSSTTRATA